MLDLHSHLLPGIDDGCAHLGESLESIEKLMALGYSGSFCTPHIWPQLYPANTPEHIAAWVDVLRNELSRRGIGYRLWAGGEVRLFPGIVDWLKIAGVPTLGESRYVLCDFWEDKWERHLNKAFEWMLAEGYTPILAHPERVNVQRKLDKHLDALAEMGVLMQGNFQSFSGELGRDADARVRRFMDEDRYTFLAMDMHRPDALPGRIDGMEIAAAEYGRERVETLADGNIRRLILGEDTR